MPISLVSVVPYHLHQNSVKVGRIRPSQCSTLSASRVDRLRVRRSFDPVDQRLVRPACQDEVESPRMHLLSGRISLTRFLWRVVIEQPEVKGDVDSRGSSHDTRGDEKVYAEGTIRRRYRLCGSGVPSLDGVPKPRHSACWNRRSRIARQ